MLTTVHLLLLCAVCLGAWNAVEALGADAAWWTFLAAADAVIITALVRLA